jgi:C-terminal processing protease CtpA/Prc
MYLMTPEETEEKPEMFSAWPVGTGLQFEDRGDEIVISALLDGSPAKEAGLSESFLTSLCLTREGYIGHNIKLQYR